MLVNLGHFKDETPLWEHVNLKFWGCLNAKNEIIKNIACGYHMQQVFEISPSNSSYKSGVYFNFKYTSNILKAYFQISISGRYTASLHEPYFKFTIY